MTVFTSALEQMAFLFLLIALGYLLRKLKAIPDNSASVLSKLENNVFIPALMFGTFAGGFTLSKISSAWQYLLGGAVVVSVSIPIAIVASRLCSKDDYIRKIYTYGLSFSNFGFMGNAVVKAIFPEVFPDYLILVLPLWAAIYVYGVPSLLIPSENGKGNILSRLKAFLNPMFISMAIGMVIGIASVRLPSFFTSAVDTLGDCMSPVAMVLTGITVAEIDLKKALSDLSIYAVSAVRLIIIPLIFIAALTFIPIPMPLAICILCSVAMPLGLNTIVVPKAYGLDSTTASGMALVSHVLSCGSIPLIFMLFEKLL